MKQFDFYLKTKIYFGPNREQEVGQIIKSYGYQKILVHFGQGSAVKSGLMARIEKSLKEEGIEYILFGGAKPNPEIPLVRELVSLLKKEKCDLILAIGGGSAIDSAKMAALGYYYEGDPLDISLRKYTPTKSLPVATILTIAAAGSEMSESAVISDPVTKSKMGFGSSLNRPVFSVLNPELTYTVSKYQTAVGVVDIMMHTLERYFLPSSKLDLSDRFAEALLKEVMKAALIVIEKPDDYEARSLLMLASSWSHNGLMSMGKKVLMPAHQLEHAISGLYPEVAHGAGLAVVFPAWALHYYEYDLKKFDQFAKNVMDCHLEDASENAKQGILKLKQFFAKLDMPLTFGDLGIEKPDIEALVLKLTNNGTRVVDHFVKPLDQHMARKIFKSCLSKE